MEQNYEKQYQEDLERAQALSLESLALEQFKNKRLLELQSKNGTEKHGEQTILRLSSSSNTSTTKVIRASSLSESDTVDNERGYNRQLMRPRPSVGSATTAEGTSSLIIPPPKSSLSSTAGKYADTSPDLISFASPPPLANNEPTKHQQQLQATLMWQSSIDTAYSFNSIVQQTPLPQQRFFFQYPSTSYTSPIPPTAITHSSSTTMANALFHPPTPHANIVSNNNSTASLTNERSQSVVLQQAGTAPILPPKNQTPKPPPIRLPSRNSCQSKHSSSSSQKGQHTSESKWKQNATTGENLIDLGAWSPSSSSTDEKNSVRVSILQEFDPILSDSSSVYNHTLRTISPECPDDASSVCESVYDCYDPYDIYTGGSHYSAGSNSVSEPIYASVIVKGNQLEQAPPLPPRSHTQQQSSSRMTTIDRR